MGWLFLLIAIIVVIGLIATEVLQWFLLFILEVISAILDSE